MPDVNLIDYSSQLAANARQQRMAELLQQQAMEPIPVTTAGNAQVPIPWTAVLAKVLQAGAGAYASNRADKRAAKIKAAQDTERKAAVAEILNPTRVAPGVRMEPERLAQLRAMAESVDPRPVRAAPIDATGMIPTATAMSGAASLPRTPANVAAALQNNVPPATAQQIPVSTAPLVTALGGTPPPAPTAMPSPVAMPPMGNPALQGNGEGMTPRAIAALRAENMRNQGPITPMAAPLVGVEGQSELDRPKTAAERQSQYLQAIMSGDPTLAAVGSSFYERGAKREEKAYDTKELIDKIDALKLDPKTTSILQAAATFGGGESVAAALVKSMTPEELTGNIKQFKDAVKLGLAVDSPKGFEDFNNLVNPRIVNQGYGQIQYNARDLVRGGGAAPNLDAAWIQIKKQEGGLGKNGELLVSPAGAVGPSQMLPSTGPEAAKIAGLQWDPNKFRTDAAYNEALGKAYYGSLVTARKGDFAAAALDYHTGAGNVDQGKVGPAGQKYLNDFQNAFSGSAQPLTAVRERPLQEFNLDPETADFMADQALAGDKSVFTNLGRGAQGSKNILALRTSIMRKAREQSLSGSDMAQINASFAAATSEARAIGTRSGAANTAAIEVPRMATMSTDAYAALPRGDFVPFNKLRRLVDHNLSSADQSTAYTADVGLITAWARALNPQGTPRLADIERGEKLLNTASSAAAHDAVVKQMVREAEAILAGTAEAKAGLKPGGSTPAPPKTMTDAQRLAKYGIK